jgi:hypothetical protein
MRRKSISFMLRGCKSGSVPRPEKSGLEPWLQRPSHEKERSVRGVAAGCITCRVWQQSSLANTGRFRQIL